jgi:hypothetical protein
MQRGSGLPGRGWPATAQQQDGGARDGQDDDEDGYRDDG